MTELTNSTSEIRYHKSKMVGLVIFIVLSASCIAVIVPSFLDIVVATGNHVVTYPGGDIVTDYVLGVLWAAALGVSIFFWPISSRDRRALLQIWLIKAIVVLVLMLAYEYQYSIDIDGYFVNAIAPDFVWEGFKFGNGTYTMQQLAWLHLKIVPGSYHAAKVGCALIGLVGVYLFYRAAVLFLRHEDIRILYILALFPSILFWSSILGKDPITLMGISLCVYGVVAWDRLRKLRYLITIALGILIVSLIRMWLVPILMAPSLIMVIIGRRSFMWRTVLTAMLALAFVIAILQIQDMWNIKSVEDFFRFRSYATTAFIGGGSSYKGPEINGFIDMIIFLPLGIFSTLFRPLPWDVPNLFGFLQSLDNLVLLLLLVMAVKRTRLKELKEPLVLWAISFIIIWAALHGLVVFNFGTLVRYKLQILPVLLGLLLYLSRRRERSVWRSYMRFPMEVNVSSKLVSRS